MINSRSHPKTFSLALAVVLGFFIFFRPQILHPLLSSVLIVVGISFIYVCYKKGAFNDLISSLGLPILISLAFISTWSLVIDIYLGAIGVVGFSSQFGAVFRLFLYIFACFFYIRVLIKDDELNFKKTIFWILIVQILIAFVMFVEPSFKNFMYKAISGYDGSEKIFKPHFVESRIFGWSEELFFLAPVFMVFSTLLYFSNRKLFLPFFWFVIVFIVAIFNARLAIVGVGFGFLIRFGLIKAVIPFAFFIIGIFSLIIFVEHPAIELVMAEFQGGGSRTLNILINSHFHYLLSGVEVWIGGQHYLYAWPERPIVSDVGWVIILNYGGYIYVFAWLSFIYFLCRRAFPYKFEHLYAFLMVITLGVKGLVFSGNAIIAFLLCLVFLGGYRFKRLEVVK